MREIIKRFNSGEQIPAHDFNHGGLDFFHDVVWPQVITEQVTRQLDFDREVWYQKVHPIETHTDREKHLSRPTELKNGTTYYINPQEYSPSMQEYLDNKRLNEVREQLKNVNL